MAKRTTPRLWLGEYVHPDPEQSQGVFSARIAVMEATRRQLPEFLKRLSDEVFPEFCRLVDGYGELRKFTPRWKMAYSQGPQRYGKFDQALTEWARSFNAEEEWVLEEAWLALQIWHKVPKFRESLTWGHSKGSIPFDSERFKFEWGSWLFQWEPWIEYRKTMQKGFEKAVREFESKTRAAALAHGLIPAPRTHSAVNFDWFVLYQFRGLSSVQIAAKIALSKRRPPDPSTILRGVRTAQKLVGWKRLRKDSPTRKSR